MKNYFKKDISELIKFEDGSNPEKAKEITNWFLERKQELNLADHSVIEMRRQMQIEFHKITRYRLCRNRIGIEADQWTFWKDRSWGDWEQDFIQEEESHKRKLADETLKKVWFEAASFLNIDGVIA